jgi:hypothetical protein
MRPGSEEFAMRRSLLGMFVLVVAIAAVGLSADGTRRPLPLGREPAQPSLIRETSAETGRRLVWRRAPIPLAPPSAESAPRVAVAGSPEER